MSIPEITLPGFNVWLTIPSSWSSQIFSQLDFDAITIDMQHGLANYETALAMISQIVNAGKFPIVRVSWNSPGEIMRILDGGALGVIAPMINSMAEAEEFAKAVKYPKVGERSIGPIKAEVYYGKDYHKIANQITKAIAMIETESAINNIDEILDVEGIDGIYIGTMDLSYSLGIEALGDLDNPILAKAIDTAIQAAAKRGLIIGMHARFVEEVSRLQKMGINLITPINDSRLLKSAAEGVLNQIKKID